MLEKLTELSLNLKHSNLESNMFFKVMFVNFGYVCIQWKIIVSRVSETILQTLFTGQKQVCLQHVVDRSPIYIFEFFFLF